MKDKLAEVVENAGLLKGLSASHPEANLNSGMAHLPTGLLVRLHDRLASVLQCKSCTKW